jgi:plasmid maintenance system antidote protein VapI
MPMRNPPHPGAVVLREFIEPLGLTIAQATKALGVTRTTPLRAGEFCSQGVTSNRIICRVAVGETSLRA